MEIPGTHFVTLCLHSSGNRIAYWAIYLLRTQPFHAFHVDPCWRTKSINHSLCNENRLLKLIVVIFKWLIPIKIECRARRHVHARKKSKIIAIYWTINMDIGKQAGKMAIERDHVASPSTWALECPCGGSAAVISSLGRQRQLFIDIWAGGTSAFVCAGFNKQSRTNTANAHNTNTIHRNLSTFLNNSHLSRPYSTKKNRANGTHEKLLHHPVRYYTSPVLFEHLIVILLNVIQLRMGARACPVCKSHL